jgi:hypothetical protein
MISCLAGFAINNPSLKSISRYQDGSLLPFLFRTYTTWIHESLREEVRTAAREPSRGNGMAGMTRLLTLTSFFTEVFTNYPIEDE